MDNNDIRSDIPLVRQGDRIGAKYLNKMATAINQRRGSAKPPSQVMPSIGGGGDPAIVFAAAAATTTSITQSGLSVDGITLTDGEIILDKDNSTAANHGLWVAHSGSWTRSPDDAKVVLGSLVSVYDGVINDNTLWIYTDTNTWAQINAPGVIVVKAKAASATLSGSQTVDTISCTAGDLVLIGTTVYQVASGAWVTRYVTPKAVFVYSGSANGPLFFGYSGSAYIATSGVFT